MRSSRAECPGGGARTDPCVWPMLVWTMRSGSARAPLGPHARSSVVTAVGQTTRGGHVLPRCLVASCAYLPCQNAERTTSLASPQQSHAPRVYRCRCGITLHTFEPRRLALPPRQSWRGRPLVAAPVITRHASTFGVSHRAAGSHTQSSRRPQPLSTRHLRRAGLAPKVGLLSRGLATRA